MSLLSNPNTCSIVVVHGKKNSHYEMIQQDILKQKTRLHGFQACAEGEI